MATAWNLADVRTFLGSSFSETQSGFLTTFDYQGSLLQYQIIVDPENDVVLIGADDERPFGPDSIVEISIPCDSIRLVPDGYYPGQQALEFRYGSVGEEQSLRLMLSKRPDGDLKIWPAYPMPPKHPLHGKRV
jgi:hypothetical protein